MTATSTAGARQIRLGEVTVTRVGEYSGPVGMTGQEFFPDSEQALWDDNIDWLAPDFFDAGTQIVQSALQTWVVRSAGATILVDTGAGNFKERPYAPVWGHLDTGYLADLARAGVRPEDVDIVINTHLHIDHVGWNTVLEGREWVPTFPRARYLMPARDFEFWDPANGHETVFGRGNQNVFEDSVAPVYRAGLVELWDDSLDIDIDGAVRLELAAGHTPGSSVVTIESGGSTALLVGDVLHNPVQILRPDANSCFCEDPQQARATRRRLLARAADSGALVIPAHLGGSGAVRVQAAGAGFAITDWASFGRL
ncbi:MBL fold metallo-hydrolase [Nocardia sp. NPDC088792]|uniref:MBL fold metallo-hydrolase n=1 Tax=Nocardia sp. NPDC088792 TaxID=3364332 RepID=UPI0037F4FB85